MLWQARHSLCLLRKHARCTSSTSVAPPSLYADQNATWVDRHAPPRIAPFLKLARVDRPIGTALVLLPAWAGLALGADAGSLPEPHLVALFGAGAVLVRGAGCTVNDLWDARFDAAVARTRERPLASGRVSRLAAAGFLVAQLGGALWCLLQLNWAAGVLGAAVVPLVGLYPALKRVTHFPQVALGLAMNWGVVMGGAAVHGRGSGGVVEGFASALGVSVGGGRAAASAAAPAEALIDALLWFRSLGGMGMEASKTTTPAAVVPPLTLKTLFSSIAASHSDALAVMCLYAGCGMWTVVYDTIYAHQDRVDDARLKLKSTALWLGPARSRVVLGGLTAMTAAAWGAAGAAAGLAPPFYVLAGAASAHLAWQVSSAKWDERLNLTRRFVSNQYTGALLAAGVVAGRVLQTGGPGASDEESGGDES